MVILWILLLMGVLYICQAFVYEKYWKKGIHTEVHFQKQTMFEGEKGILEEVVVNDKALPIVALKVKFQTSRNLKFVDNTNTVVTDNYYRNDIISVMPYRQLIRKLEFIGEKRGYYTIEQMTLVGTDLFLQRQMVSENECHTALYVYPKPYREKMFQISLKKINGEILSKQRIIEDPFEFRGIREYEPYDDIRYIHWKATAKTGELKVVQKNYTSEKNIRIFLYLKHSTMIKREDNLEDSIRILAAVVENYLSLGSCLEIHTNCEDIISGKIFSMEKMQSVGMLDLFYKSLARLNIQKIHDFEETMEHKIGEDTETTTILISPYGNADLQEKLCEYIRRNDNFYFIYPKRKDDITVIRKELTNYIFPIILEGKGA